jgi:hypothetical protein
MCPNNIKVVRYYHRIAEVIERKIFILRHIISTLPVRARFNSCKHYQNYQMPLNHNSSPLSFDFHLLLPRMHLLTQLQVNLEREAASFDKLGGKSNPILPIFHMVTIFLQIYQVQITVKRQPPLFQLTPIFTTMTFHLGTGLGTRLVACSIGVLPAAVGTVATVADGVRNNVSSNGGCNDVEHDWQTELWSWKKGHRMSSHTQSWEQFKDCTSLHTMKVNFCIHSCVFVDLKVCMEEAQCPGTISTIRHQTIFIADENAVDTRFNNVFAPTSTDTVQQQ